MLHRNIVISILVFFFILSYNAFQGHGLEDSLIPPTKESRANSSAVQQITIKSYINNCFIQGKMVYGYQPFPNPDKIVSFELNNPQTLYTIGTPISLDKISGATWIDDKWWCSEYTDGSNSNIWIINHITGDMTLVGASGSSEGLNGLAYDDSSNTLYACGSKNLFKINMVNGAATLIGSFGITDSVMSGLACDGYGTIYANDLHTDSLYLINPTTGAATLIGSFGVDLNHGQDMEIDKETGTCYLAAFTVDDGDEGALYTCDLSTAALTKIGNFGTVTTQITGFAIPYSLDNGNIRPKVFITYPAENQIINGTIKINGTASDLNGNIDYVYLKIGDEQDWIKAQGKEKWEMIWDTTKFDDGIYIISAVSIDNQGLQSPTVYRKVTVQNQENKKEANIDCIGDFHWINLKPKTIVNASFIVKNIGDSGSLLNWNITDYPTFGTWHFSPSHGSNLKPEDGLVTVNATVIAPNVENMNFSGQIIIQNIENASDYEIINVSLSTISDEEIIKVIGGFGVKATITAGNIDCYWTIKVDGKYILLGGSASGVIDANTQETVKLPLTFAFGKVQITVTANQIQKQYTAFALGPIFLKLQKT